MTLTREYLVQKLIDGALGFEDGVAMVHGTGKVGVCEGDAAEGSASQHFTWRRLPVLTEEETRLWIQIGVAPAIEDYSRNVAVGIKAGRGKHGGKLFADSSFVVAKRS